MQVARETSPIIIPNVAGVANVSDFDMWDSYLPQYAMGFQQGNASGAMCSYFAANGVPSCGSDFLMNQVVRGRWAPLDLNARCGRVAEWPRHYHHYYYYCYGCHDCSYCCNPAAAAGGGGRTQSSCPTARRWRT